VAAAAAAAAAARRTFCHHSASHVTSASRHALYSGPALAPSTGTRDRERECELRGANTTTLRTPEATLGAEDVDVDVDADVDADVLADVEVDDAGAANTANARESTTARKLRWCSKAVAVAESCAPTPLRCDHACTTPASMTPANTLGCAFTTWTSVDVDVDVDVDVGGDEWEARLDPLLARTTAPSPADEVRSNAPSVAVVATATATATATSGDGSGDGDGDGGGDGDGDGDGEDDDAWTPSATASARTMARRGGATTNSTCTPTSSGASACTGSTSQAPLDGNSDRGCARELQKRRWKARRWAVVRAAATSCDQVRGATRALLPLPDPDPDPDPDTDTEHEPDPEHEPAPACVAARDTVSNSTAYDDAWCSARRWCGEAQQRASRPPPNPAATAPSLSKPTRAAQGVRRVVCTTDAGATGARPPSVATTPPPALAQEAPTVGAVVVGRGGGVVGVGIGGGGRNGMGLSAANEERRWRAWHVGCHGTAVAEFWC